MRDRCGAVTEGCTHNHAALARRTGDHLHWALVRIIEPHVGALGGEAGQGGQALWSTERGEVSVQNLIGRRLSVGLLDRMAEENGGEHKISVIEAIALKDSLNRRITYRTSGLNAQETKRATKRLLGITEEEQKDLYDPRDGNGNRRTDS